MNRYDLWKTDSPPRFEDTPMIHCDDCGAETADPVTTDAGVLCRDCAGPACELCGKYATEDNAVGMVADPTCSDGRLAVCQSCSAV